MTHMKASPLKVEAAQVPWSVDPAIGFVRLAASDEDMPIITLLGEFLRPEDSTLPERPTGADDGTLFNAEIEIKFKWPGGWVRVSPCSGPPPLDLSALAVVPSSSFPRAETLRQYRAHLEATGNHPCPHIYRVTNSPWIADLGLDPARLRHFLVHGDNALYEVIAAGFSWRALRWLNFE